MRFIFISCVAAQSFHRKQSYVAKQFFGRELSSSILDVLRFSLMADLTSQPETVDNKVLRILISVCDHCCAEYFGGIVSAELLQDS